MASKRTPIRTKPMVPKGGYKPRAGKKKTRYDKGGILKKKQS